MTELSEVAAIKQKHQDWLMGLEGVRGVGIGKSKTGDLCIKVFVTHITAGTEKSIHSELSGTCVEITESGEIKALSR